MNFLKKAFFALTALCIALALFGCTPPIYDSIRKEVTLKKGTVSATVRSIIRFNCQGTEYLYISNGGDIFRKVNTCKTEDHSYGNWEKLSLPKDFKDYVVDLAADSNYLYAFTARWEENTNKGQNRWNSRFILCSEDGTNWQQTASIKTYPTKTDDDNTPLNLFCTNSLNSANRRAYYNDNGKVYELNGTTATEMALADTNAQTTPTAKSTSCAALGATIYFFDRYDKYYGSAACSNEYYDDDGNPVDATVYYYGDSKTVAYGTSGGSVGTIKNGDYVYSLAVTKDYLLVGTDSGIKQYKFELNCMDSPTKLPSSTSDFETNAAAIMSSGYEVNTIVVINPEREETKTAIYSSMDFEGRNQQFSHACIWAYYPSRGNWNRD